RHELGAHEGLLIRRVGTADGDDADAGRGDARAVHVRAGPARQRFDAARQGGDQHRPVRVSALWRLDSDLSAGDESANTPTNPYRYTGKRYDSGSKTLDMGARQFSPDTGRFLQMDTYSGELQDMALGTDPLTQNRYALAAGNPISFVEVDGHNPCSITYSAYQDQTSGTCVTASTTAYTGVSAPNDGTGFDYTTADSAGDASGQLHVLLDGVGLALPGRGRRPAQLRLLRGGGDGRGELVRERGGRR
ncbi:MAG: hypothetical protein M3506_08130, partial [Chloroflexota bacterium]|nr:hypothetical protein [Chloroflexota bacterium]